MLLFVKSAALILLTTYGIYMKDDSIQATKFKERKSKKRLGQNKEPGTIRYNLLCALDKSVRTYSRYDKVPGTSVPVSFLFKESIKSLFKPIPL
ncbi:hypothetical protein A9C19_13545 [Bacillus weihaiensis]|uniref:Uncharacterized protein n=1 Tax=Bacillus weihaiensis TaxID=1547283 RepID=A0A1L3MTN0_9BACI|nr:hypothetical protein A9C19_13545 [Bacillus weihaiensis]